MAEVAEPFVSSMIGTPGVKYGSPTRSFPRRAISTTTCGDESEAAQAVAQPTLTRARDDERARASDGRLRRSARASPLLFAATWVDGASRT